MDTQKRYALEMQARYLRYLQAENEAENKVLARATANEKRTLRKKKEREGRGGNYAQEPNGENAALTMDRYVAKAPTYRLYTLIIDSNHRDVNSYPNANDFVVRVQETFRNVAAVRVLRTEFYQPSNSFGYFVLNEMKVPLQLYNVEHAYLYLNGYISTAVANDTNVALFGRIGPGTEFYPAVTADIFQDPYIYAMNPVEPRLRKFHVKLLTHDGQQYPVNNARVVLTIAIYCMM